MEYSLRFSEIFEEQFRNHKKSGRKIILKKIETLLLEIIESPRTGTGQPERLKNVADIDPTTRSEDIHIWSRRIDREHRLTYRIFEEQKIVYIMLCEGHYTELGIFYDYDFSLE